MSVRGRRRLFSIAAVAWLVWVVALAASLMTKVGSQHILAQYAILAVAVMTTLVASIYAATAPVLSALRALVAADARQCPRCALHVQQNNSVSIFAALKEHSRI